MAYDDSKLLDLILSMQESGWTSDYFRVLKIVKELRVPGRFKKRYATLLVPKQLLKEAGIDVGDRVLVLYRLSKFENGMACVDIVITKPVGMEDEETKGSLGEG